MQTSLLQSGNDRKQQEKAALQRDTEDLENGGKWLSETTRAQLTASVRNYFATENRLDPDHKVTPTQALAFQSHLLLHFLNDDVIPVVRSEIFCKLQLGTSLNWDKKRKQYVIEVTNSCQFRPWYSEVTNQTSHNIVPW
jgi:hypothetical protein